MPDSFAMSPCGAPLMHARSLSPQAIRAMLPASKVPGLNIAQFLEIVLTWTDRQGARTLRSLAYSTKMPDKSSINMCVYISNKKCFFLYIFAYRFFLKYVKAEREPNMISIVFFFYK